MNTSVRYSWYRFRWWLAGKLAQFGIVLNPVHLDIETAANCNLACTMCAYGEGSFKNSGLIPDWIAKAAIKEGRRMGMKSIKFNYRGEPGLNKKTEDYAQLAKDVGYVERFMNTNGLAWSEERIKALDLDRVIISVDGATKETYEKIRKGGNWGQLLTKIEAFHRAGHKITLQFTMQADNQHEVEQFRSMWPKDIEVKINPIRKVGTVRQTCPQPFRRLIVGYDGKVFGCCANWDERFPVGNARRNSLRQIWRGERIKELRNHARAGTGPCEKCDIREAWKS